MRKFDIDPGFSIVDKMREFFWIISLFDDISIQYFLDRFQVVKYFRKNPANTDEVRIQDTIFFLLKMYIFLQNSKISK